MTCTSLVLFGKTHGLDPRQDQPSQARNHKLCAAVVHIFESPCKQQTRASRQDLRFRFDMTRTATAKLRKKAEREAGKTQERASSIGTEPSNLDHCTARQVPHSPVMSHVVDSMKCVDRLECDDMVFIDTVQRTGQTENDANHGKVPSSLDTMTKVMATAWTSSLAGKHSDEHRQGILVSSTPNPTDEPGSAADAVKKSADRVCLETDEVDAAPGVAFLHCFACSRLDIVEYGHGKLPAYLKESEEESDHAVVFILCGTCRQKPKFSSGCKYEIERRLTAAFDYACYEPKILEKGDGIQAARFIAGSEVRLLRSGDGPAYKDVDRIVNDLGADDRVSSVNMDRYIKGRREHIRLAYLRGGLTSGVLE